MESAPLPSYALACDPSAIDAAIRTLGADNVVCVMSTTSCFAPRLPDDVMKIGEVCAGHAIPHVVNNAYGVQSPAIMQRLDAATRQGASNCRLDITVQSGDKNFLVPVGGSAIAGPKAFVDAVAALYAGRASASPAMDLFITFMELGAPGWDRLLGARLAMRETMVTRLTEFAHRRNEVLVAHGRNDISLAVTLRHLATVGPAASALAVTGEAASPVGSMGKESEATASGSDASDVPTVTSASKHRAADADDAPEQLGARLFWLGVTGPRIIRPARDVAKSQTSIGGVTFANFGTHSNDASRPSMLIIACGIGMTQEELDKLMARLEQLYPVPTPRR